MSSDERVDAVDLHDVKVNKTITLKEAHDNNIPHRISTVLIFKPSGKIVIQAHKEHGRLLDHSVGGHVSAGENYETAAKREMMEELGLDLALTHIVNGVVSEENYPQWNTHLTHILGIFSAEVEETWSLQATEEVDQVIEMQLDELVNKMNDQPEGFLQGFLTSLGAYLISNGSSHRIKINGKIWGECNG